MTGSPAMRQGNGGTPPVRPNTPVTAAPPARVIVSPDATPTLRLSADDAARIALRQAPTIAVAQGAADAAAGRVTVAEAALRPTFGTTLGYTLSRRLEGVASTGIGGTSDPLGNVLFGGASSLRTSVTGNLLLTDFGRTLANVRSARAAREAFRAGEGVAAQDAVLLARTRLYDLLQNRRLVAVAESNLANRRRQLDLADARLSAGLGPPADVVQARAGVSDAVAALVAARNAEAVAGLLLSESLGLDPRTPVAPADEPDGIPPPDDAELPSFVATALGRRPEIVRAERNVAAAENALAFARRLNGPALGGTLGFTTRGATDPFATPTLAAGLTLSWPFADGGVTRGRTAEAEGNRLVAEANLRAARLAVVSDVGQAFSNWANAAARESAAADSVANATELVRLAEGRYAGGVGTFVEIVTAQGTLDAARRTLETARADRLRFRAALRRAVAEPLP